MSDTKPAANLNIDDKLQAEIEAALGDMSVDDMLDVAGPPRGAGRHAPPISEERQLRKGRVMALHADLVLVEFGPKSQGACPVGQFETPPEVGSELEFVVERFDEKEGLLVLSREGAVQKAAWENLEVGQVLEARCTGMNKGGLEMEVASHKAFMPAGQVDIRHIKDISVFLSEKMTCQVIELDKKRGRIILSRRAILEVERLKTRDRLLSELTVGTSMPAVITSVQAYGAFADLGGIDGLIHISDMSHSRLKHPSEVVKEGQQVQVQILKIDTKGDQPRIGLGMKQCMADPYQSAAAELVPGATVSGKVTKIMPFGAFVEVAPGVEGLIHISELSHDRVHSVSQVVKPDEIVTVKVLSIDPATRRVSLSLKALKEKQEMSMERREDNAMRKLKAKWGDGGNKALKGGIG